MKTTLKTVSLLLLLITIITYSIKIKYYTNEGYTYKIAVLLTNVDIGIQKPSIEYYSVMED